jgi:hypothetical protein
MNAVNPLVHSDRPVSKILVLDESPLHAAVIKEFCQSADLVPLKVRRGSLLSVLETNIDLGGIVLAEDYGGAMATAWETGHAINARRPELPIFLRREGKATLDDLPEDVRRPFCAAFDATDMEPLRKAVSDYIFCLVYPNALVRGISEITETILADRFPGCTVRWETPYVVHDRVIFGEVLSLIQLESAWCRGYMMLQAEGEALKHLPLDVSGREVGDFREANNLLSELTNLIWGSFKNRFIGSETHSAVNHVQVPLIVNLEHKYMSFGTTNPQLCFRFTLTDGATGRRTALLQRFVFNINWSPEDFRELSLGQGAEADAGALELF